MTGTNETTAHGAGADSPAGPPASENAPDTEETADHGTGEAGPDNIPEAEPDEMELLIIENADLKDKLLRAVAETENVRRRGQRERAEATLYAATNFAKDLLSVGDNLTRTLEAVTPENREAADDLTKSLLTGVDLTERELLKVFERHGILRYSPVGEKFDPNMHQAMFEVPDPATPAGTVVQVMQPGYRIGERVLRPAMVGVAKGGPRAVDGSEEEN